jgi:hypothetical protein
MVHQHFKLVMPFTVAKTSFVPMEWRNRTVIYLGTIAVSLLHLAAPLTGRTPLSRCGHSFDE